MTIIENIALLLVRLIIAIAFIHEARVKFKDIRKFAVSHGLPFPLAVFVALAELLAGISMALGYLTLWSGIGIILLMINTIGMHLFKWHSKYWAQEKGWEYDVTFIVLALVIVSFGGGNFGLDYYLAIH